MIPRAAIQAAISSRIDGILDDLVAAGDPLDAHPLEVDGEAIRYLEEILTHLTMRWVQRRGVKIRDI